MKRCERVLNTYQKMADKESDLSRLIIAADYEKLKHFLLNISSHEAETDFEDARIYEYLKNWGEKLPVWAGGGYKY